MRGYDKWGAIVSFDANEYNKTTRTNIFEALNATFIASVLSKRIEKQVEIT